MNRSSSLLSSWKTNRTLIVLAPILAVALLLTAVAMANDEKTPSRREIPIILATDLGILQDATNQLDASLSTNISAIDTTSAYKEYLGLVRTIDHACRRTDTYQTSIQGADVTQGVPQITDQTVKLCKQISEMAEFSLSHYQAVGPIFKASHQIRRYETWPPFSSYKLHQMDNSYAKSRKALKQLPRPESLDNGVTDSYIHAVEQGAMSTTGDTELHVKATRLRTMQEQLLAARVSYWRSTVGIADLQKTETNLLNSICAELSSRSDSPEVCQQKHD